MSVKKKDRHLSRSECLNRARVLTHQIMIITRPRIENDDGSVTKAGILGSGQPYYAFGMDLFKCAKQIHSNCYRAVDIYIKSADDLEARNKLFKEAIDYCDSIMRLLDLCIFEYARNNKKKMKSFAYIAQLTKSVKDSLYDRMNLDNMILQNIQRKNKKRKADTQLQ